MTFCKLATTIAAEGSGQEIAIVETVEGTAEVREQGGVVLITCGTAVGIATGGDVGGRVGEVTGGRTYLVLPVVVTHLLTYHHVHIVLAEGIVVSQDVAPRPVLGVALGPLARAHVIGLYAKLIVWLKIIVVVEVVISR